MVHDVEYDLAPVGQLHPLARDLDAEATHRRLGRIRSGGLRHAAQGNVRGPFARRPACIAPAAGVAMR